MGTGGWLRLQVGDGFTDGIEDELAIFFGIFGEADSSSGFMATSAKGGGDSVYIYLALTPQGHT
jgi:hypothetical protein